MNVYVWALKRLGYIVSKIHLHIIARDWRASEQQRDRDYPSKQCGVVEVPIWEDKKVEDYINERIKLFIESEDKLDDDLPYCTEEERWADPDRFAVVKKSGKSSPITGYRKALPKAGSFLHRSDAQQFISSRSDKQDLTIEYRKGESRRCQRGYCKAAPFCNQFKEMSFA